MLFFYFECNVRGLNETFFSFCSRLGPCELQEPVWAKMSALATGVNKKRKKSDTKPQAQM